MAKSSIAHWLTLVVCEIKYACPFYVNLCTRMTPEKSREYQSQHTFHQHLCKVPIISLHSMYHGVGKTGNGGGVSNFNYSYLVAQNLSREDLLGFP